MRNYRDYRLYLPALVFMLGTAFVWNARSQAAMPLRAPLTGILDRVDGYRVVEQRLSDDERRVAGMSEYVARAYMRDTSVAFTTFVSYYERQTQGKTIHSPKNCLPGAGWEVVGVGTALVPVAGATEIVNRYVLKNQGATALVYYWYQGRGRVVASEYAVKANLLRDAAFTGHTEESLVRIVIPISGSTAARTLAADSLADSLGKAISARLITEVARALP